MSNKDEIIALLQQLGDTKQYMVDDLVAKGEEASIKESFNALAQKSADYIPKTYILVDENGNEMPATLVEQEVIFDATENDVRVGKVFATSTGVKTGTKVIPSYHTKAGYKKINSGSDCKIPFYDSLDLYDFTELQIIVCLYSDSITNSVQAEKVVIGGTVYNVNSAEPISTVTKDSENKTINLGFTNNSGNAYVLRYFIYKEIE